MRIKGKQILLTCLGVVFLMPRGGFSQQTKPTLDERIIRLEEGQKRLEKSIDALRQTMFALFGQVDKRFEQVDKRFEQIDKRFEQIDKRFEQVDKRFDDINSWLRTIVAIVVTAFGGMFGLWLLMWRKLTELGVLHRDGSTNGSQVEAIQRQKAREEEFEKLKKRIEELEAKVAQ